MHVALGLRTHRPQLEAHSAPADALAQLVQALDANVLQLVLESGCEVRHKLGDGAPVEHRAGHALSNEQPVAL